MARNKYPEETVNLILDVAFRLFMEKGYEHTSIQDIIDHLGGLSKGAIYHHFKSKEDILYAVMGRMTAESNLRLKEICDRTDLNGKEKLKTLFRLSLDRPVMEDVFTVSPNVYNNPRFLSSFLHEAVEESAPDYILPIIRQGIADGSITTEYPEQLAQLISLLANIWINPIIFEDSREETYRKFVIFDQVLKGLGLNIVDQEMLERMCDLSSIHQNNN
ncbi:TetR/AcrR family transcriptional regulator [bacterium 0.1xD8-71]|nr:TetR/AcrR family transcriptional regulator [bacterium 0.1xD8-71]